MRDIKQLVDSLGGAKAVAGKMGITVQAVYAWCKVGRVSEGTAYKLAHVYQLDPEDLLRYGRENAA